MGSRNFTSEWRRLLAVASGLLMVIACLAMPVAALASAVESCHSFPLAQGRCDGTSAHFGHGLIAVPAEVVGIPDLPAAGRPGSSPRPPLPGNPFRASITARASPLS